MQTKIATLAQNVGTELHQRGYKIVTAESCTGGGISYYLTSIPGSSAWFERGLVTYSNAAKVALLDVAAQTLDRFGSVSEQTAREMAEGALKNSEADISIAITGIAGPDGGTAQKPVGTVWIAYASKNAPTQAFVTIFPGQRQMVREQTIVTALENLLTHLQNYC
jgi:nicotinamide-nucleotide amidase